MAYPSVVTSFPTHTDGQVIYAADINNIQTDVVAIETFVGTISSVAGTLYNDVRNPASGGGGHVQTANLGGTGQTSYNKGDTLAGSSSSVLSKLTVGADGTVLTADSTQTAGVSWQSNANLSAFTQSFRAVSSIVGGTGVIPVYVTPYQTDGGIQLDSSAVSSMYQGSILFASVLGLGGNNYHFPYPVSSLPNRMLVAEIAYTQSGTSSGVDPGLVTATYGTTSLVTVARSTGGLGATSGSFSQLLILPNASVTTSSILAFGVGYSGSSPTAINCVVRSYYNVASVASGVNLTGNNTSLTINSSVNGALVIGAGNQTLTGGTTQNSVFSSGDSGQLFPSQNLTITQGDNGTSNNVIAAISLAPISSVNVGIAMASAASSIQSATFVGFSKTSIASGQSGAVITNGVVTGLSSIQAGAIYYLSNTTGQIQTTPGTINKKVGTAVSSVAILLTNT